MDFRSSNSSILTQPVGSPSETQPLLSPIAMPTLRERLNRMCVLPRHLCLPSKAAVLILFWSAIVGTGYTLAKDTTVAIGVVLAQDNGHKYGNVLVNILIPYVCLALVMLLYPLSGFMADIWCGRYKSVIISMCILMCSFIGFAIGCTLNLINDIDHINRRSELHKVGQDLLIAVVVLAFLLFIIGLSGFQANFIQLGLDQLHEAPSEYLGIFVHWAMWAGTFTAPFSRILYTAYACARSDGLLYGLYSLPIVCSVCLTLLLLFSCWKHHWFYTEPGQDNPYKMVLGVLRFAKKHSYPLQRSAFTFDGSEIPTRIDFAKQRYGGPFLTKQVEDVKTFLRILAVLVALGPIYILEVPASNFVFPLFSLHTGLGPAFSNSCTSRWLVLESGTLGELVPVIGFPLYIWLIYSFLRRCIPKIFTRLFLGGSLLFLCVFIMSMTDLFGHLFLKNVDSLEGVLHEKDDSESYCMFNLDVTSDHAKALNLSWGVHVIPNILIGISPILITTTTFEFISAQSPHSMKGLLVGMFFAIKGVFQLLSAFLLLPFSLPDYWTTEHPKKLNCGFGYLFLVSGLAFIGLVIFSIVAKKYKYRERDDPPYDQMVVEEVYARNINQMAGQTQVYSPDGVNSEFTNSFPIHVGLH